MIYEIMYAMAPMTAMTWHVPVPLAYCHQTNVSETSRWNELLLHYLWNVDANNNDKLRHHNICIIHMSRPTYILGKTAHHGTILIRK